MLSTRLLALPLPPSLLSLLLSPPPWALKTLGQPCDPDRDGGTRAFDPRAADAELFPRGSTAAACSWSACMTDPETPGKILLLALVARSVACPVSSAYSR